MSPQRQLLLVVDDDDAKRYTKARALRAAGYEVIEASDGMEALALVEAKKPRLVILDVGLPDMSGWEVCRRVKSRLGDATPLVLQVSSTFVTETDTVASLDAGADASLLEPLEPQVLIATVRALLRARQAEDALREALDSAQAAQNAAEAANRSKDEFLAVLSHELRTPLGAILTWVTLLRSGRLSPERAAQGLEAIERNARAQSKLIDDLLDTSRIISGKMRLDVAPVDLGPVVANVVETARTAAAAKSIALIAVVDPGVGPLTGDATRLQQAIWNLVSNAVKFTPRGGRVEITISSVDSQALIEVRDNGKGISPEFLPQVFDRFRQADSSSTRTEGGLGLGLAIVRHLVELHGGTVRAESEGANRGSVFQIRLPLPAVRVVSVAPRVGAGPRSAPSKLRRLDGLRILVVDDEVDAREAIAAVLEECGATPVTVESVADAMAELERSEPALVLSDIGMPAEDGYAFIEQFHALTARTGQRTPAIALTAYASSAERQRILEAGFDACITKPVEAAQLVDIVGDLVGEHGRR